VLARSGLAPAHEARRVERAREESARGERVADRARAVVAAARSAVPAAPDVRRRRDLVRRGDDATDDRSRIADRRRLARPAAGAGGDARGGGLAALDP